MADVTPTPTENEPNAPPPEQSEEPKPDEQPEEVSEKPEQEGEEASEDQDDEKTQATADKGAQQAETPPDAEDKRRRAGGWQRKIERLERMNEQLLQQLGTQRPPQKPDGQPEAEKTPETKAAEYLRGLVRQEREQWEAEQAAKTRRDAFTRRTAEVRAQNPDFDDVVLSVDTPVSPALEHALLTSEQGPTIMYQLAKSPDELARLCALPPLDAAREIGRLEARLASGTAAPKTTKPALRPPAPPTSVNGSTASTRSLEDLPLSDYKRAYRSGRR